MPAFKDQLCVPYTCEEMFALAADVGSYPKFLPWCKGARIYKRREDGFLADLMIGFQAFKDSYTSNVILNPPHSVVVEYVRGPLKHVHNQWHFTDDSEGGCIIDFEVDFQFKSALLDKMIGAKFESATRKMMNAFEGRAIELYGAR